MTEGTPKAIEIKGIVRNATKIGVQDGQAEDLINLRFVDGSWRASGDGRLVHTMSGTIYQQLYVHTNVYHHLLGVNNGKLYWFANIENDGTTFTPLEERKELTSVTSDVWITQSGHLLTVIDEAYDFEHFVFKLGDGEYSKVIVDTNGSPSDRTLYPFGGVHFNLRLEAGVYRIERDDQYIIPDGDDGNRRDSPACIPKDDPPAESTTHAAAKIWHADMLEAYKKVTDNNRFTAPFLALIAVKLYDGTYAFASNPVLLNPREALSFDSERNAMPNGLGYADGEPVAGFPMPQGGYINNSNQFVKNAYLPVYSAGTSAWYENGLDKIYNMKTEVWGADMYVNLDNIDIMKQNKDVFTGIGIFITRQSNVFYQAAADYTRGNVKIAWKNYDRPGETLTLNLVNVTYAPGRRTKSEIIYDLLNSPFYLFRDYNIDELDTLKNNNRIDMQSDVRFKGILSNITAQKTLQTESSSRATYLPKTSYMYNGRIHIANYKTYPFFGYPIDAFHLHNHSVVHSEDNWFKDVLPNTAGNHDANFQYPHNQLNIQTVDKLIAAGAPYYVIRVVIESQQGEQEVVRYLPAYNTSAAPAHTANFIEDLNPVLCYPDARAKRMKISYVRQVYGNAYCEVGRKDYPLKPHPYLNIAYYIDPNLKPIEVNQYYDTVYVDF